MTIAASALALRKAPRRFALVWALILFAGCGGESGQVGAGEPVGTSVVADHEEPSTTAVPPPRGPDGVLAGGRQGTVGCEAETGPVVPEGAETVGDPGEAGFDVIGEHAQTVQSGHSATFAIRFEGAPAAVIWVVPGGEGISPSLDGADFARDQLFGATMAVAALTSPADGPLVVRNDTGQGQDIAVIVLGQTGRRLSIDANPSETAPNEPVTVTVRLTEPTETDRPCAIVTRDGAPVASLTLRPAGAGTWRSSFRPEVAGEYGLVAWVGGDRPRRAEMSFLLVRSKPEPQHGPPSGAGSSRD